MNFYPTPPLIEAKLFATVPKELYGKTKTTRTIPNSNKTPLIFIEGITSDPQGNLYIVDIPYGQIFHLDVSTRKFTLVKQYGGEPNGMAVREDGMLIVADHKEGLLLLNPADGEITPLISRHLTEHFKGPNDLVVASNGDIYFTDQGQTGLSDQTGRVYRLSPTGKLDTLLSNGISPNGLVLSPDERILYVAMTRDNSVWLCPLHPDGTTTKVARFFNSFGASGPDGLTVDEEGNLFICHPSLGCIFVVDKHGVPRARIVPPKECNGPENEARVTNVIFGSTPDDRQKLYFTSSTNGDVLIADWHCAGGTPIRATKQK